MHRGHLILALSSGAGSSPAEIEFRLDILRKATKIDEFLKSYLEILFPCTAMLSTTNWALGRPAYQSSQYLGYSAELAVDGNNDTTMLHNSCTETNDGPGGENWWMVDLGRLISVAYVVLTNRGDCCCEYGFCSHYLTNTRCELSFPFETHSYNVRIIDKTACIGGRQSCT